MTDERVELRPQPFTPTCDSEGRPTSKIAPYLPVRDPCTLCPARCCRLNVKVSLPDALHFCTTLGVPFFAGLTLVPSEDPEHAFALDPDPRFVGPEDAWPGTAEIQLRRREDGGCASLVKVGEHERCGVYSARPSFCRTYPASWRAETVEGGPATILCPVPYGIDPDAEAELRGQIQRSIRLWRLHDEVVGAWNAAEAPRTPEAFLRFAIPRVAARLEVDPGPTLAEGTRDQRLYDAMVSSKVVGPARLGVGAPAPRPFADLPPRPDATGPEEG